MASEGIQQLATCPDPSWSEALSACGETTARRMPASPVVVRLAGLPAQALVPLASPSCIALLQELELLEQELAAARHTMVEAIADALPEFDATSRRFLLTVKRSCFNARDIGKYRGRPEWAKLLRISPDLAERIVVLEARLLEKDRSLVALYTRELARERRHVLDLVLDRRFLRGVALGRPGLVRKIRSRAPSLAASGFLGKPAKWELSLLRFVTRAAAKLSANSTLTTYALGSLEPSSATTPPRFSDAPRREASLVRVDRLEIEQFLALLMRHPVIREHALVAWNDSLEEVEPGRYRFLRSGFWTLDPGADGFRFVRPSRVTVKLSGSLLSVARDALREGALRYDTLLALLADKRRISMGATELQSAFDELVDLGLLILMPPWPTCVVRLEQQILRWLRTLPEDPVLRAAADRLDELVTLEDGFATAPHPEHAVAEMEAAVSRLLDTVFHLAGHQGPLPFQAHFFEDVLVDPGADVSDGRGALRVAAPIVREVLRSADLLSRFAGLFNHRHDVLHTLAAWWREHEPSRREIPFAEVARGFAPLWKQFLPFHETANQSALNTFNPLNAPVVEQLRERREALLARCREVVASSPEKDFLSVQQLAELVEALPRRYAPMVGSCVFVQPLDAEGSSYVLNRLHEGTGRYLSRVTPVVPEPSRQRFLDHLVASSVVDIEGEEADLLEVMHPWSFLMNVHPPQTAKVLAFRDMHLDLPRQRVVRLEDLTVQADLDSETFRLVDPSGRRLLPVHLSTLGDTQLSNLLRLLLVFGPGETRGVLPFAYSEDDEDVLKTSNRLTCGRLVLRRRQWKVAVESLPGEAAGLSDLGAYAHVQGWRRRRGLPSSVFYHERTYHGAFKPQYLDFSSPSLCRLFLSSLRQAKARQLIFRECLPTPTDFPFDASMNRRGVELLIDSLVIRTARGDSSAGVC